MYTLNGHVACKPPTEAPKGPPSKGFVTAQAEGLMELEVLWDTTNPLDYAFARLTAQPRALVPGTRIWIGPIQVSQLQSHHIGDVTFVMVDYGRILVAQHPSDRDRTI